MTSKESGLETLGPDYPGPTGRFTLSLLVPAGRREEFVGDLIEEAETVVLPERGQRAARRWFWRQALASASPLYARHMHKEVDMNRTRWIVLAVLMIAGPMMALDSNIKGASSATLALVGLAILVPAVVALLSGNLRALAGAALSSAALLLIARLISGVELRWYAMAWIFFIILAANWLLEHRLQRS